MTFVNHYRPAAIGQMWDDICTWSNRAAKIDSDQMKTFIENGQGYETPWIINILEYLNQTLKVIWTSLAMLVALMCGFHVSEPTYRTFFTLCNLLINLISEVQFVIYFN